MPTPTFVQANTSGGNVPAGTFTLTYTNAQTAGDTNVIVVGYNTGANPTPTILDTSGNSYVLLQALINAATELSIFMWVCIGIKAAAAGANTVTINLANPTTLGVGILEYSGVNSIDTSSSVSGTGANPPITLTLAASNEMFVAALYTTDVVDVGPGTGWNGRGSLNFGSGEVQDLLTGPGSVTPVWGGGSSSNSCVLAAVALSSSSPSAGVPCPYWAA